MVLTFERAASGDLERVAQFYYDLIEDMADDPYHPRWEKGVYPDEEMLRSAVEAGEMVMALDRGEIRAAMILNHSWNEGYDQVTWENSFDPEELLVIHILGVQHRNSRKGIGKAMVRYAIDAARREGRKAIRLDVLKGNVPAEKLYPSMGFRYLTELPMYYEDTGWMIFELYELVL